MIFYRLQVILSTKLTLTQVQALSTYQLLDSGFFRKLEQIGSYKIIRPCPQAFWEPALPKKDWNDAIDEFVRSTNGKGQWQTSALPDRWQIEYGDSKLHIKPTGFGHIGLFAEQKNNWEWLRKQCQKTPGLKTINLFAYSGGSSIAMRQGGANVTHLDASKPIVEWAKENAALNGLDGIRWIVDDVSKYLAREVRRGNKYDGFVLDPPSFGRGPKNELWKIEEQILELLRSIKELLSDKPKFILFSCHSPHFTPKVLENIFHSIWPGKLEIESFEMLIEEKHSHKVVPSGVCARVSFK